MIEKGLITPKQLEDALAEQRRTKEYLGAVLLRRKHIKEKDLLKAISEKFKIPFVSIKDRYINCDLIKRFSRGLVFEHKCLPLEINDMSLTVAIVNPLDMWMLKKTEEETLGFKLKFVLISEGEMRETLERCRKYL